MDSVRVPVEPTMGMFDDFCAVFRVPFDKFLEAYKAMLAAAPAAEPSSEKDAAQTPERTNAEGYPGIVHDFETVREALVSLVAVARRYLPDYDEHPEVQKADDALAQCEQQPMLIGGSVWHSQPNAAGQDTMPDTETNVDAQASNRSNVIVGNERPSRGRSLTTPAPAAPDGDTPMTDAAAHGFVQMNPQKTDIDMWGIECVDADFARQLERRLRKADEDMKTVVANYERVVRVVVTPIKRTAEGAL
jgi:hypothetical protein